jgi:hypothetical protein
LIARTIYIELSHGDVGVAGHKQRSFDDAGGPEMTGRGVWPRLSVTAFGGRENEEDIIQYPQKRKKNRKKEDSSP